MDNQVKPILRKASEATSKSKNRTDYEESVGFHGSQFVSEGPLGVSVVPTVSGAAQALLSLNAGAANLLMGFRATAGSGDDIVASGRLSAGFPSAAHSPNDGAITFNLSAPVSRVDVVGVMNGSATGNCIDQTDTEANAQAQLTTFDFSTPVDKIVVSLITDPTSQYGEISVEGYSYA